MSQRPSDQTFQSLNQLVIEGRLTPQQAQAALDVGSGQAPGHPSGHQAGPARDGYPPLFANSTVPPWLRPEVILVLVGTGLLMAAVGVSTVWSRGSDDQELDWGIFATGLVATALLLAGAAAGWFLTRDPERRTTLLSWPGALGAIAVGLMIAVAMDDNDLTPYVSGGAIVALCAVGYLLSRQSCYSVGALVGLVLVYLQAVEDLDVVDDMEGDNVGIAVGLVVLVFTLVVTAAGWLLPSRDLTAVIVGSMAVASYAGTLFSIGAIGLFTMAFTAPDGSDEAALGQPDNPYVNDTWVLIGLGLLLCVLWSIAWWLRGHVGFKVLVVAMLAILFPAATFALVTEHAARWGTALAALGGVGMVLAVLSALGYVGLGRRPVDRG